METVGIEIPKDMLEFLQNMVKELKTQDNCATADPYYYVVRTHRYIPTNDGGGDKEILLLWEALGDPVEFDTTDVAEAREEIVSDYGWSKEDADAIPIGDFEQFSMKEIMETTNIFFTKKGYEDHMKLNRHNYRGHYHRDPHAYVEHAFRNPEIKQLLEVVRHLGETHEFH